jgi:hypothetical protein
VTFSVRRDDAIPVSPYALAALGRHRSIRNDDCSPDRHLDAEGDQVEPASVRS